MELRTDTIGSYKQPTEEDIKRAIEYPHDKTKGEDIVKLQIDERHYICFWIGSNPEGHRLIFKFGDEQLQCNERFPSDLAIEIMIKYLNRDTTWFKSYTWNQPIVKKFLEQIDTLKLMREL